MSSFPPPVPEPRTKIFGNAIVRIVAAIIPAGIAWAFWPGADVFNKGLASLTLGDICALGCTFMFGSSAFKIMFLDD